MTLEEAKEKIEDLGITYYRGYKGFIKEHPEMKGDISFFYKSEGIDKALYILEEVDE